ncbi:MAG: c-type cytochrome [Chitinophagaceae bacterium]
MKKKMLAITAIASGIIIALVACNSGSTTTPTPVTEVSKDSLIKRGEYLVSTIGCDDCHSPKVMGPQGPMPDMEHRFAGHMAGVGAPLGKPDPNALKTGWMQMSADLTAAFGPWGISYAANISSDETGIGNWTEQQFIKSLREGKMKGMTEGRPMLPPMPWPNFAKLNDTDLKAIFAYLKTTKPIKNVVPGPKPMTEL